MAPKATPEMILAILVANGGTMTAWDIATIDRCGAGCMRPADVTRALKKLAALGKVSCVGKVWTVSPEPIACMCGAIDPPRPIAEDGLERCIHCGCH